MASILSQLLSMFYLIKLLLQESNYKKKKSSRKTMWLTWMKVKATDFLNTDGRICPRKQLWSSL